MAFVKPTLFDGVKTLVETKGELTGRVYPIGTTGTIVECMNDAYIIEFPVPGSDKAHGYFEEFDVVTLRADQFTVTELYKPEQKTAPFSRTTS